MPKNIIKIHLDTGLGADVVCELTGEQIRSQLEDAIAADEKFIIIDSQVDEDDFGAVYIEAKRVITYVVRDFEAFKRAKDKAQAEQMRAQIEGQMRAAARQAGLVAP